MPHSSGMHTDTIGHQASAPEIRKADSGLKDRFRGAIIFRQLDRVDKGEQFVDW